MPFWNKSSNNVVTSKNGVYEIRPMRFKSKKIQAYRLDNIKTREYYGMYDTQALAKKALNDFLVKLEQNRQLYFKYD